MKAGILTGTQHIAVQDRDYTSPAPGYVTVDTKCTGICGTDLHLYFGHLSPSPTFAAGHETCGLVKEIGNDIRGVQPGDRVVIEPFIHCGRCVYCRTGQYNHCLDLKWFWQYHHGGFAEHMTVHASQLFKLPDSMSFEQGALVEPLAVAYRALNQAGSTYQDRLAIIGGGSIGLLCLAMAKAAGISEVLITIKYEQQAQLALAYGADHVVQISETDLKDYVADITDGFGMDAVIETVGGSQAISDALTIARKRGTVVLVAVYHELLEIDLLPIMLNELIVTGSKVYAHNGLKNEFQAAIDLIASGKVEVTKLVTHRYPLAEIGQAFQTAADKRSGAVKVMVYRETGED